MVVYEGDNYMQQGCKVNDLIGLYEPVISLKWYELLEISSFVYIIRLVSYMQLLNYVASAT